MSEQNRSKRSPSRSWDPVAEWYAGWSGARGSDHHRKVAIPAVLELLEPAAGQQVLDVGCGPGALAPHIATAGARYTGLDASRKLIAFARRHHGRRGRFVVGDATRAAVLRDLGPGSYDAAVFLLSLQDIDPLQPAVQLGASAVRPGGRVVVLMTHPCFRIPRQSGWGWDGQRKLQYRRIDHYLTPLDVPMKRYGPGGQGATRSYHRPLETYVEAFAEAGLLIERIREIPSFVKPGAGTIARAERRAQREVPLFLGLRAIRAEPPGYDGKQGWPAAGAGRP